MSYGGDCRTALATPGLLGELLNLSLNDFVAWEYMNWEDKVILDLGVCPGNINCFVFVE